MKTMFQLTFKRYEIKYLLTDEQRQRLAILMGRYMVPDEWGPSTVCNVYCDTPSRLLVRRSAEHPDYKEKVRIRSYGVQSPDASVFVELKKKYDGVVYKRRILADATRANALLSGAAEPADQIEREIAFAAKRYEGLVPACYITYDRCAFFAADDRGFRVTFDRNIRWREDRLSLSEDTDGEQLLEPGTSLMEVKCAGAMPLWLVGALTAMRLFKTSFSKYGTAWARSSAIVAALPAPARAPRHAAVLPPPAFAHTQRRAAHARVA
jgi:hypothetical protein